MGNPTMPVSDRPRLKRIILTNLGRGRHNAIKSNSLAWICGYDSNGSDRMTRKMIALLIEEGYPIASTTGNPPGFFIAETKEEVQNYAGTLKSRLIKDAIRRRDFLRASRPILQPEQLKLGV